MFLINACFLFNPYPNHKWLRNIAALNVTLQLTVCATESKAKQNMKYPQTRSFFSWIPSKHVVKRSTLFQPFVVVLWTTSFKEIKVIITHIYCHNNRHTCTNKVLLDFSFVLGQASSHIFRHVAA